MLLTNEHQRLDTVLTADAVEWCHHHSYRSVLACGTYQLNERTGEREGNVQLYRLESGENWCVCSRRFRIKELKYSLVSITHSSPELVGCQKCEEIHSGVLDMKW